MAALLLALPILSGSMGSFGSQVMAYLAEAHSTLETDTSRALGAFDAEPVHGGERRPAV